MRLDEQQINDRLARLTGWNREGNEIVRSLEFDDFKRAILFVNRVADLAEQINHHPDILVHGWNKVRLSLTTHDKGGLTERDFSMAEKINSLF